MCVATTQIDLAVPDNDELRAHQEVVREDIEGNEVALYGITIADAGARGLIFRCPRGRLAKVRIRFRWYTHAVTFRNVSFDPEHVTQVTAKVTKLQTPPERSVAILPGGLEVEPVGMSFHDAFENRADDRTVGTGAAHRRRRSTRFLRPCFHAIH